jgi:hypothetical protein
VVLKILIRDIFAYFNFRLYTLEKLTVELLLERYKGGVLICNREVLHVLAKENLHLEREIVLLVNQHVSKTLFHFFDLSKLNEKQVS